MPWEQTGNTGSSDGIDCVGSNRWVSVALLQQQPRQGGTSQALSRMCDKWTYLRGRYAYQPWLSHDLYAATAGCTTKGRKRSCWKAGHRRLSGMCLVCAFDS